MFSCRWVNRRENSPIRNLNEAPDPERGIEVGLVNALQRPVDIYFATWKKRDSAPDSKSNPVGYFVFVDGKFRWDNTIVYVKNQFVPTPGGGTTTGSPGTVPLHPGANGISYPSCAICRVPALPEGSKANRMEGTVILQVIIQPDGRASDFKVIKSPNVEIAQKAIEAVETWRFSPARDRNGQSVPVIVPIEVTFHVK